MARTWYDIGGRILELGEGRETEMLERMSAFELFRCREYPSEALSEGRLWGRVIWGCKLAPTRGTLLHSFALEDGTGTCRFYSLGDEGYRFEIEDTFALEYDGRDGIAFDASSAESDSPLVPQYLHFALWMAWALLAVGKQATPIHASTIVHDGKAVLFLGESGTGKSTHTRLWLKRIPGASLLNDDSPILAIEGGRPYVYGSPWSGKTPCYKRERYPLAAAVRLSQAPTNHIRQLPVIEAIAALFPSCPPALAKAPDLTDSTVKILSALIAAAPVYHLDCLPDSEAAALSFRTIFKQSL